MHETDTPNQVTDAQAELLNQLRTATEELKAKQRTTHLEAKIDEIVGKKKEIREEAWAKDKSPNRPDSADDYATVHAPDLGGCSLRQNPTGEPNLTNSMVSPSYTPECIEGGNKYLLTKGDMVQNTTRDGIVLNALSTSVSQIFRRLFTTITNPMNNNFEFEYFIGDNSTVGIECEKDPHSNTTKVMFRLGRHLANAADIRPLPKPYGGDQADQTYTVQFPDIVMRVIIDFMLRRFKLGYRLESAESQAEWTQLLDSLVSKWRAAELRLRDVQAQNDNLHMVHGKERREQQKAYRELKERYAVAMEQWEEERRASAALQETVNATSAISQQRQQTIEAYMKENKQLHSNLEHYANTQAAIQREVVELRHRLNVANMELELLKAKPKERSTPRDLPDRRNLKLAKPVAERKRKSK